MEKYLLINKKTNHTFFELLKALDKIEDIKLLRISSIEPNLLSDEIISLISKSKRISPHFHLPLQSGSNDIFRKMYRRYIKEPYAEKVEKIKYFMPQSCIGIDVIVGFQEKVMTIL